MAHGIPARLSAAEGRKFAFTVGAAFAVLAGIVWWRQHQIPLYIFSGLAVALLVAGAIIPGHLSGVYRAWMGLALLISKVTTPIFMGIVYYVVLTPIGLLMRALGRNPIKHAPVNDSYWAPRTDARGNLTNQF